MSGGLGRAMGGYDEMVFRTMVRDDAYIYDVVGLESEGTAADFQTGANSYLYGTRFMTWLCYTYGPDKLMQWVTRGDEHQPLLRSAVRARCTEWAWETAWEKWIAGEREVSGSQSGRHPQVSGDQAAAAHRTPARVGVASVLRREGQRAVRGSSLSGAHGECRGDSSGYRAKSKS